MPTYAVWKYFNQDGWNYTIASEDGYSLSGNWTKVQGNFESWESACAFVNNLE